MALAGLILLGAGTASGTEGAVEYDGVEFPARQSFEGTELHLSGCGSREAFFFDIYVAAIYLPETGMPVSDILSPDTPKAVRLHIVYDGTVPDEVPDSWAEPLDKIARDEIRHAIADVYADFSAGDRVTIAYTPSAGTGIRINDSQPDRWRGHALVDPLLRLWIGERAVSANLRQLLLSGTCGSHALPVGGPDGR